MNKIDLYKHRKYVTAKADLPEGEHFAILYFSSIYIPGDERSRTNPGHGYPEYDKPIVEYVAFTDREAWEEQIRQEMETTIGRRSFQAIHVRPANVTTKVEVKIS